MKKMQCPFLKIIAALLLFMGISVPPAYSQISTHRLQMADSLFNAKQFTQSLEHYESILARKEYTPAMLLKMAFVEEGLNRIGEALYYLNLYYLATGDESVLDKMEALSKKHKLYGYTLSETGQALFHYQKNHNRISLAIGAVMLLLLSLAVFLSRRKQRSVPVIVTVLVLAALFGIHLFMKDADARIIVAGENNYLMAGPSGAAAVVDVIGGGHRFEVEKRYDVWVQVRWKGKRAFLREHQVLPVRL